jgi:hypothetical protein
VAISKDYLSKVLGPLCKTASTSKNQSSATYKRNRPSSLLANFGRKLLSSKSKNNFKSSAKSLNLFSFKILAILLEWGSRFIGEVTVNLEKKLSNLLKEDYQISIFILS